jgi:hypothetical protein
MSDLEIDIDRLADYAAGLLDPAEAAEVEQLITTEPGWSDALDALRAAEPRVQALLADQPAVPVPDDVLARWDAALARERRAGGAEVLDLGRARTRRRWRWPQLAGAGAAVAAAVAICFGGAALLHVNTGAKNSSTSGGVAQRAPQLHSGGSNSNDLGGFTVLASGTDYTSQTVADVATVPRADSGAGAEHASVPDDLARLTSPTDRAACLAAITGAYGGVPTLLDYARYQGKPALVVVLSGSAKTTIVVAGPSCGLTGKGSDTVYVTTR